VQNTTQQINCSLNYFLTSSIQPLQEKECLCQTSRSTETCDSLSPIFTTNYNTLSRPLIVTAAFQPMVRSKLTSRLYLILGITHSFSYWLSSWGHSVNTPVSLHCRLQLQVKKMHVLQPGSLLGCLVQTQIKFNFISPAQLFLVRCKQNMPKIPYHAVTAHNSCTVPASSQHVRLKNLRVVTEGGKKVS